MTAIDARISSPIVPQRFSSLLVANRGEIAVRIMAAARTAGLRTVAVYSDPDREAPQVRAADVAVRIGPGPASESYLSIPALVDAAGRSGADAVHPGYGFLSERSEFAAACARAGLAFVGPPADVIQLMGRKDLARQQAVLAGVPVLPAVEFAPAWTPAELIERGRGIGYPLLVKAAAGGGGKGMRIVRAAAELPAALTAARREAMAAFGSDIMLLERYVEHGRHIEVQIIADTHGSVLHLFERDCSVQRRHQKVIEEAPAAGITPGLRALVTSAAVALARQEGYVNAGTVEFLVDAESPDAAYLLEMNTRLQVEHPVTESITGLDLVGLQLLVAQGEPLPLEQQDLSFSGHAIEARVYAEDPETGFLPQAGRVAQVQWPTQARVDAALEPGQQVGTWYDPMLAKIIVHGATRDAARMRLIDALDRTAVIGLPTNIGFLRRLANSSAFANSGIDTAWLDRTTDPFPRSEPVSELCAAALSICQTGASSGVSDGPFGVADGWRSGAPPSPRRVLLQRVHSGTGESRNYEVTVDRTRATVTIDGRPFTVRPVHPGPNPEPMVMLDIDDHRLRFLIDVRDDAVDVCHQGQWTTFGRPDGRARLTAVPTDGQLLAPMPGVITVVSATIGQQVDVGDVLGVLEAMKMELLVKSPFDGTISRVGVDVGTQVAVGQVMFVIDPTAGQVDAQPVGGRS